MEVICGNCGGRFDDSEDKCPYCGSIYEPGAEKKYMETLEGIKNDLDRVDDDVLKNAKNEVKRFFKSFIISAVIVTILWLIMFMVLKKGEENKKVFAADAMKEALDEAVFLDTRFEEWNKLYDIGEYDLMTIKIKNDLVKDYNGNYGSWKHYSFFSTYSKYMSLNEHFKSIEDYKVCSEYDYSGVLYELFNLYCEAYTNEYTRLSYKETEILRECYETGKEKAKELLELSEEDFEKIKDRLVTRNTSIVIRSECEKIAKERLGE